MSASFRSRVVWASLACALGILPFAHLISLGLMIHFPFIFRGGHAIVVMAIAAAFIVAGVRHVRTGLSSLNLLRVRLAGVREGKERRIAGNYPSEVQPLVNELNALLEHSERTVHRANIAAGDLAHGLKTPLAVLSQEAGRMRAVGLAGLAEHAAAIDEQVERMRRQVDFHLAHARAAGSGATPGARCAVAECVAGLVRTLERLHAERHLQIHSSVSPDVFVRAQREDLEEMLGNLLDNACKWAASRIEISTAKDDAGVSILVEDDGRGIDQTQRELVLQRGTRADEAVPGSGLGLAIVRDLAQQYTGSIELETSPHGGLRARLRLPSVE